MLLAAATAPAAAQIQTSTPQISDDSPFRGGVPMGTATPTPIALTLGDVIQRALANNLGLITSEGEIDRARGVERVAYADLLPNLYGRLGVSRQITNLEAFGFPLKGT